MVKYRKRSANIELDTCMNCQTTLGIRIQTGKRPWYFALYLYMIYISRGIFIDIETIPTVQGYSNNKWAQYTMHNEQKHTSQEALFL